jgi:2-phosphosulfolactate phosphatase
VHYEQIGFDVRCEWGERGLAALSQSCHVVIVVDVLSFSTAVEIAVARGASVIPYPCHDGSAAEYAQSMGAVLASRRGTSKAFTLSPASLLSIPSNTRLVLPSPNGSSLSLGSKARLTLSGCLRNAAAVAAAAAEMSEPIAVIPAGERWEDGSLRPAWEDLVGAGAIIHSLPGRRSPEAQLAMDAFSTAESNLPELLLASVSGKELAERGFIRDVQIAGETNVSRTVPILRDGAYVAA